MPDDNGFLLPGEFDPLLYGTPGTLHEAGLDWPEIRRDMQDVFPNDTGIGVDTEREWDREHLPQFGPAFVPFVHERFTALEKLMRDSLKRWQFEPVTAVFVATMNSDGSGNVNLGISGNAMIYEPPPGFTFALHRLTIFNNGNTFGSPFMGAGGYWELRVDNEMIDGGSLVSGSGSFPVVKTWGTRDAPHIRDGEVASLFVNAGPVSKAITVKGQGTLDRTTEG